MFRLQQQLYIYLLQRYLLMKYQAESECKLQKLMNSLPDLQIISETHRKHSRDDYKENVQYFGPLFREIYS